MTTSKTTPKAKTSRSAKATAKAPAKAETKAPASKRQARKQSIPKLKGGAAKLAWIQQQIRANVEKTGTNLHHKYDYFQEHGVIALIEQLLQDVNAGTLLEFPPDHQEQDGNMTYGYCYLTVYDADLDPSDPAWGITARYPCTGQDNQDKGVYKMQTQGAKYAYQKMFRIKTEAIEDVDSTESDEKSTAKGKPAPARQAKKVSATKAAALRATAAQAVEDGKLQNTRVTAYLTSSFAKSRITELTDAEATAFEKWLAEQIGG